MDYKKKYEETLERCREFYNKLGNAQLKKEVEEIFPELKESEDERIRKELIRAFTVTADKRDCEIYGNGITYGQVLAWLEKQGLLNNDKYQTVPVEILDRLYKSEKELEELKQGEQKSTDKVEPKFKIEKGKWYVCDTPRYADFVVGKAYLCPKNEMLKPYEIGMALYVAKHCFHLWTIQDAKDGDVLKEDSCTFIIERMKSNGTAIVHCCLFGDDDFDLGSNLSFDVDSTYPATKEQRDLLFQKMKESGYEWDDKKKKLKQIEQKASIDFSDLKTWKYIVDAVLTKEHGIGQYLDNGRTEIMAKELQDRFGNIAKAAWSKEDEKYYDSALWHIKNSCKKEGNVYNWLKSLKEKYTWKPSDEQMDALNLAIGEANSADTAAGDEAAEILTSLYEQLKKLKGEQNGCN